MTLGKWSIPRTFIDLPVIFLFSGRAAFAKKVQGGLEQKQDALGRFAKGSRRPKKWHHSNMTKSRYTAIIQFGYA